MPKKSSRGSRRKTKSTQRSVAWRYGMLIAAVVVLAMSSYLAEAFGDNESSLGPKLFYYQTAALVRPFSVRLHKKIAGIYSQTGRFGEAVKVLNSPPQTDATTLLLAQALIHNRQFPEAGNVLSRHGANSPSELVLQSWALFGEGNIPKAKAIYARSQSGGVSQTVKVDADLLGVLLALPNTQKASRLLRASDPDSTNLKPWIDQMASYASPSSKGLETAELYRSLSLTRPALTTVNSVIVTSPDYVPAIGERISISKELGQTQKIREDRKMLKNLNPTHKY